MKLIDADAIYQWYTDAFDFSPNEIRFSMNDIRDNLYNIPTIDAVPRELYESMESTCYKLQQALSESWIPCSERLPKEDEEVLVYLYGNVPVIAWLDSGRWCSEDFDIAKEDEPIAWVPLPEPYGGEKE